MKLNYADRRNDTNIIEKEFMIQNINSRGFVGKASLINLKQIKNEFIVTRPNGKRDLLMAKDYHLMTLFPKEESYCITVMYDAKWQLLQWYFDIAKDKCQYDANAIPYSEDAYLDIVVLPDGTYYTLDENELEDAYQQKIITKEEYEKAYCVRNKMIQMLENEFEKFSEFTNFYLKTLQHKKIEKSMYK